MKEGGGEGRKRLQTNPLILKTCDSDLQIQISKNGLQIWRTALGVANGTLKNVSLRKFWQDLEIWETFLISREVSFFDGLFLLFLSLETFHQIWAQISN